MIKITERKYDGWFYTEERTFPTDIYERERDIFDRALLCLFSDGDAVKEWNAADNEGKKKVIYYFLLKEIDNIKDNLRVDLRDNVKIYPLIRRTEQ